MGDGLLPVDLGSGGVVEALAAGSFHTCVRRSDGSVKCWGNNYEGHLGVGSTSNRGNEPGEMGESLAAVLLDPPGSAVALTAGGLHTCALLADGSVRCWGGNTYGGLGLGDTVSRGDAPGEMGAMLPAVELGEGMIALAIDAGRFHTCAILNTDGVKCWGANMEGNLGLGDRSARGDGPSEMGDSLPMVRLFSEVW
jgi:alpha-tubulin suppressor-like RCC1 family protein